MICGGAVVFASKGVCVVSVEGHDGEGDKEHRPGSSSEAGVLSPEPHCEAWGCFFVHVHPQAHLWFRHALLVLGLSQARCRPLSTLHSSLIVSRNSHTFYPVWSCAVAIALLSAAALHRPVFASEVCFGVTQQQDVQMYTCG